MLGARYLKGGPGTGIFTGEFNREGVKNYFAYLDLPQILNFYSELARVYLVLDLTTGGV